jgi:hypothetical protein
MMRKFLDKQKETNYNFLGNYRVVHSESVTQNNRMLVERLASGFLVYGG